MEEKKGLTISSFIQGVLVLYITFWTIAPPLQIDLIYRLAALGAAGLWIILNIPKGFDFERIHILAFVFLMLVVAVALVESKGDFEHVLRPINYYLLVLAFLMAHCYKDRWDELSWIVPIILLALAFFNYKSYQVVEADHTIARLIVRDDVEIYDYMRQGVGGYGLLYSQVCVFPVIVAWIYSAFRRHKLKFAIGIVWLVSYLLYLSNAGYSIAVMVTFTSLIILLFYKRKNISLAVIITALIVLLIIWLIGYNDAFRNALLQFFDGTKVASKINDVYLSITTEDTADSVMSRITRYKSSINVMFTYPIIGGLWFKGGSGGGHSAMLDTFAKYGAFGGYVFIRMVFDYPSATKEKHPNSTVMHIANAALVSLLFVLLFDSLPYNLVCTIMFILPICFNDINNWFDKKEDLVKQVPDL